MSGQAANESRKEVAKRMNDIDCSKQKSTGTGESPHGNDHYDQGRGMSRKKHDMGK